MLIHKLNLALINEPGIEIIKMGNAIIKPVIRGLSGNRVMILYQGIKTSNQAWGKENGVFIPEVGIEKIEIIKGPASLLYRSEAIGGVINFIPKNPDSGIFMEKMIFKEVFRGSLMLKR